MDAAPNDDSDATFSFSDADREAVYRAMLTRRDVRGQFLPDAVADEVLCRLLIAAHSAPSVGFLQPWSFVIVRDAEIRQRIHECFVKADAEAALMFPHARRALYRSLKLEGIRDAPVNICVTCDRDRAGSVVLGRTHNPMTDIYSSVCAVQNLWLAARAEGLGLGWVSILDEGDLRAALGIPEKIVPVAYLCLGHVSEFRGAPDLETAGWRSRLSLADLVHCDGWARPGDDAPLRAHIRAAQTAVHHGRFLADMIAEKS